MSGSASPKGEKKSETGLILGVLVFVLLMTGIVGRTTTAVQGAIDDVHGLIVTNVEPVAHSIGGGVWKVYATAHAGDEGPAPHWAGGPA